MKYALIDMGSNSIRLTVYDMTENDFRILFKKKIMAGLAAFVEGGRLRQEGITSAIHAVQTFRHTLERLEISHLAIFATASLRNISNTEDAVAQIQQAVGVPVEVISGEMEAQCGYCGASHQVSLTDGLFVDIGGASTELVQFCGGEPEIAGSVPVGSLKLYHDCVKKILPSDSSRKRMKKAIAKAFRESRLQDIPACGTMVGVGGTIRAALRLCIYLYGLPEDSAVFTREQLDGLLELLQCTDKNAINLILMHEPERIHTLIPGLMILQYLMARYEVQTITVSRYGVREGYLIQRILPTLAAE